MGDDIELPSHGPSRTLDLWGRVLDAGDAPLPGAKVYWVAAEHSGTRTVSFLHAHKVAFTDEAGAFFARGLPPGPCLLVADFQDMSVVGETLRIDRGTSLTLTPPEGREDLLLRFPVTPRSFGRVHGTVLDSKGAPCPHFPVILAAPDRGAEFQRLALTNAEGAYIHPWLLPGQYVLAVPASIGHLGGGQPFEVIAGRDSKVGLKLHARPPGPTYSVEMRVEDPLGAPVAGARVDVQAPGHFFPPVITAEDGMVRVRGLPVRPAAAGVIARGFRPMGLGWPPSETETEYGGTLSLHRMAFCRVRVENAATGRPLRNSNILVVHEENNNWKWTGTFEQPANSQEFEVAPGEVHVQASAPGYRVGEARAMVPEVGLGEDIVVALQRGSDAGPR